MTLFFGWNNTSSCIYLWRATLAFCFARLDSRTPNIGSQLLWLPSLPFFCSMTLSGKTHPAQVTRVLHSTPSVGVQLPQFLKKHLTWYYFQTERTFCRRGCPLWFTFSCFHALKLERCWGTPGLQPLIAEFGRAEVERVARGREGLHDSDPVSNLCDISVWTFLARSQTPQAQVLCLHLPSWPRSVGQDGGLRTYKDNAETLVEQVADNFQ